MRGFLRVPGHTEASPGPGCKIIIDTSVNPGGGVVWRDSYIRNGMGARKQRPGCRPGHGRARKQLFRHGNLSQALRHLQRYGLRDSQGRQLPSLDRLLERLRRMKQDRLSQYNLNSVMDEIRQRVDKILQTERDGIQKKVNEARQKVDDAASDLSPQVRNKLLKNTEDRAAQNQKRLDELPPDVGGRIKKLSEYDFMDEVPGTVQRANGYAEETRDGAVRERPGEATAEHEP